MTRTPPRWLLCPERPDEAGVVRIEVADYLLQACRGWPWYCGRSAPRPGATSFIPPPSGPRLPHFIRCSHLPDLHASCPAGLVSADAVGYSPHAGGMKACRTVQVRFSGPRREVLSHE